MNIEEIGQKFEEIKKEQEIFNERLKTIVGDFNEIIDGQDKILINLKKEINELKKQLKQKTNNENITDNDSIITISARRENGSGEVTMSKKVKIIDGETEEQAYIRTYFILLQALSKTLV